MFNNLHICRIPLARWTAMPVPVAKRSKAKVCGRSLAGVAGSNPYGGMEVCLL